VSTISLTSLSQHYFSTSQAGNYDGPPLQYTATTALKKHAKSGAWDLAPGSNLFSNEHDPRLKEMREVKTHKVTRYGRGNANPHSTEHITKQRKLRKR
jgi:hypothetical protein